MVHIKCGVSAPLGVGGCLSGGCPRSAVNSLRHAVVHASMQPGPRETLCTFSAQAECPQHKLRCASCCCATSQGFFLTCSLCCTSQLHQAAICLVALTFSRLRLGCMQAAKGLCAALRARGQN